MHKRGISTAKTSPAEETDLGEAPSQEVAAKARKLRKRQQQKFSKLKAEPNGKEGLEPSPSPAPISSSRLWLLGFVVILISMTFGATRYYQEELADAQSQLETLVGPLTEAANFKVANLTGVNMSAVTERVQAAGLQLGKSAFETLSTFAMPEKVRPGRDLREAGLRPKHPVIIIPGFVTSALELWEGKNCSGAPGGIAGNLRQRVWGSSHMGFSVLINKACWLEHLSLDLETGLDPEGIKLRAALGLDAVDYFLSTGLVTAYSVWAKLIEGLADLGYDPNTIAAETYDWRLSTPNMEKRDAYFTRLQARIELVYQIQGIKVVVMAHSWGDNVFRNFLHWMEQEDRGWADKHIHAYANIGGPVLGVPKSIGSLLSGESRETAGMLNDILADGLIPQKARIALFRSWGSSIGMLPVGGSNIWGNHTWSPEDTPEMTAAGISYGPMIQYSTVDEEATARSREASVMESVQNLKNWLPSWAPQNKSDSKGVETLNPDVPMDVDEALELLIRAGGPQFQKHVQSWGAIHADPCSERKDKGSAKRHFFNPLKCPLPNAPAMAMYCMYGIGAPVERSYRYLHMKSAKARAQAGTHPEDVESDAVDWKINQKEDQPEVGLEGGILTSDGDGTVPLISTGLMCRHPQGWRGQRLNPHGVNITTREYVNEPTNIFADYRGGPKASTHVEILANALLISDILKIAAGEVLEDHVTSHIDDIAAKIDLEADLRPEDKVPHCETSGSGEPPPKYPQHSMR